MNVQKKGYRGEVEVREILEALDFDAQRSWGSDGRSLSLPSDIDILAKRDGLEFHVQVKRRKKIASYLEFRNANIVAVREDRGEWLFIVNAKTFKEILKKK